MEFLWAWYSSIHAKKEFAALKKPFQNLNRYSFSNISARATAMKTKLENLQMNLLKDGVMAADYVEIKRRTEKLLEAERMFISQKAKINYLKQGDRCTKFFHDLIKRNNKRNTILTVTREDGSICSDTEGVAKCFVEHYKGLLGTNMDRDILDDGMFEEGQFVSENEWDGLTKQVTVAEIELALHDIDDDKAPGPDGFGAKFFKSCWNIIKDDVCKAVFEFFTNGKLLKQWNHSIIALVPKKAVPSTVKDYRPISCCTVFYKIISKIIVNRLTVCLGDLVDGAQAAFIQGRSVVDNIHLAQELMRKYARKRGSPRCILKIDLEKAYDTVEWGFLNEVLLSLKFPCRFVDWIMECVTTTSYSIVINGHYHGHFQGRRGLLQDDPLSPLLFTLCIEVLSRMLKRMSRSTSFTFHPKCVNLRLTHLAYADDLLLFSYGDRRSVSMIMQCLHQFGNMAGLRMNYLKSNIFMASIDEYNKQDILNITGFLIGTLPFRYLGIPIVAKRLCASDFTDLIDNVTRRVSSWPRNSLSYAGKIELIRSVIQGIHCFWLSILPIPSCVINSIHSICRKFVWPTKHPPIAWSMSCKPLEDGGLGLKDLKAWNRALLAKTLWNIHSEKKSLWIRWVNHVYSCFGGVWNWSGKHDDSPLIKNILSIRNDIVRTEGGKDAAIARLRSWFGQSGGLSRAYLYFVRSKGVWPWKPLLAKSCILPKHRFVLWLVAHSKLMTRDRMGFLPDRSCVLCKDDLETVHHLFFSCKISKIIWNNVRNWLDMRKNMATPNSILTAFRNNYKGTSTLAKMRITALSATVYQVWNLRNRIIFDNETPNVDAIFMKIKIHTYRCVPEATNVLM